MRWRRRALRMSGLVRSSQRHRKHDGFRALHLFFVNRKVLAGYPCRAACQGYFPAGPSFRIILNCARKSFRSKDAVRIFSSIRRASSSSIAAAAFSTSPTMSPMPRMRPGEAIRVKGLELVELFADAGELDRPLRDLAHRERRAAAGVAVELGEDEAGDAERLVEMRGHADRLLAGRGIGDEQHFLRLEKFPQPLAAPERAPRRFPAGRRCRKSGRCPAVPRPTRARLWPSVARPSRPAAA